MGISREQWLTGFCEEQFLLDPCWQSNVCHQKCVSCSIRQVVQLGFDCSRQRPKTSKTKPDADQAETLFVAKETKEMRLASEFVLDSPFFYWHGLHTHFRASLCEFPLSMLERAH